MADMNEATVKATDTTAAPSPQITVKELLNYVNMLRADMSVIEKTLASLDAMPNGDNAGPGSPGNTLGAEKAKAIADVVRCRETTNQQILAFYEKIYNDLVARPSEYQISMEARERVAKELIDSGIEGNDSIEIILEQLR